MATLPHFYHNGDLKKDSSIWLNEELVRHIIQVLRMQAGDQVQLTNGAGFAAIATIEKAEKKKCSVSIRSVTFYEEPKPALSLAVAFTKNSSRNEWLLEKATELGVRSIIPLSTKRSEREKIRTDRWNNILVAAMIQSQQYYLPVLDEITPLEKIIIKYRNAAQKLMGHCMANVPRTPLAKMLKPGLDTIVLVGPEGDFTADEVDLCLSDGYKGISMGTQRLRTETAAMTVGAYFNLVNHD